ncbi:putative amidoligase enzyme-domain-containing protein [Daldinia grandis]|nr:putative amidoligase enzyme-domain-containing protein [Daldinia grandis]
MSNDIKSSFGVEIELLIGIRKTGPMKATPRMFQLAKGKPIIPEPGQTTTTIVQRQVEEAIRIALQGHEGDRVITRPEELAHADGSHLRRYTGWGVGRDMSVVATNLDLDMTSYDWQDLEITSPALFATEKSFAEVHHVLTAIYNSFWVFAPETAGLHIHYGRGKDWIPINHLRRIAAFLYAADPILTQMHPPRRREIDRDYCPSNRHYSILAHGISAAQAGGHLEVGNLDEGLYEENPVPSPPGSTPESKPEKEKGPRFTPIFKRGTLESYNFDKNYFASGEVEWAEGEHLPGRQADKSLDIPTAVRELLYAPSGPVISTLMQHRDLRRSAYNFAAYDLETYGAVQLYGAEPLLRAQPKRTIEFRQATGTVNADEVVAHARVAVRLCEFACETDINALWIMISDFVQAETYPTWYDVFDLLFEVGLVSEAKVIQRQMAKQRGIKIIDEDLGTFKAPTVPPSGWSKFVSWLSHPLSSQPEQVRQDNPAVSSAAAISSELALGGMIQFYR